jgi:hypothetical protein
VIDQHRRNALRRGFTATGVSTPDRCSYMQLLCIARMFEIDTMRAASVGDRHVWHSMWLLHRGCRAVQFCAGIGCASDSLVTAVRADFRVVRLMSRRAP